MSAPWYGHVHQAHGGAGRSLSGVLSDAADMIEFGVLCGLMMRTGN
jgi:hypothetical protein